MTLTFTNVAMLPLGLGVVPPLGFKPSSGTYNDGVTTQMIMERNDEGVNVPVELRDTERQPTFQFGVGRLTPEMIAVKLARQLTSGASSGLFIFNRLVKSGTLPAVLTGQQGFAAVADDANVVGSVYDKGTFKALTRQPFATFVPATANSYAVGLNSALKFSDDLVGKRTLILIPYPTTDTVALGARRAQFRVRIGGVLQEDGMKKTFDLDLPMASVNIQESGSFESDAESYSVTVADLSGSCAPDWRWHTSVAAC